MCKNYELSSGQTAIKLQHGELSLVINNVPALVCPNCDEAYADEGTAARLLEIALDAEDAGLQFEIQQFIVK